jgi:NADPH-dependent stearoyl-CoA 9-desaturase
MKPHLTPEQLDSFGRELDAIRTRVLADLGERDARYIRRITRFQRALAIGGRAMMFAWPLPPVWALGVLSLGVAKILDNMEIGHNVLHGQYDFMRDPAFSSKHYEWDTACPSSQWKHSHNYMHHTHTNIVGRDRDVGYGILRMSDEQRWNPAHLGNPIYAFLLAVFFEWGVALHDLEIERVQSGQKSKEEAKKTLREIGRKSGKQVLKDYVLFPLLAGPYFVPVFVGNALANLIRNLWSFMIIFCGHFPMEVHVFTEAETAGETRGGWYLRQLLGSANISGGKVFHVMSGNLSHQIEHHLFPDLPAHRYAEIAPEVQAICEKYGLPYHTGRLSKQFGSVIKRIFAMALPPRRAVTASGAL